MTHGTSTTQPQPTPALNAYAQAAQNWRATGHSYDELPKAGRTQ